VQAAIRKANRELNRKHSDFHSKPLDEGQPDFPHQDFGESGAGHQDEAVLVFFRRRIYQHPAHIFGPYQDREFSGPISGSSLQAGLTKSTATATPSGMLNASSKWSKTTSAHSRRRFNDSAGQPQMPSLRRNHQGRRQGLPLLQSRTLKSPLKER
jgi:hypothetical protein